MEIKFKDASFRAAVLVPQQVSRLSADVVKEVQFVIGIFRAAPDEDTLKALSFLRFTKFKGTGKCSVSLVSGEELLFRIAAGNPPVAVVEGIRKRKVRAVA